MTKELMPLKGTNLFYTKNRNNTVNLYLSSGQALKKNAVILAQSGEQVLVSFKSFLTRDKTIALINKDGQNIIKADKGSTFIPLKNDCGFIKINDDKSCLIIKNETLHGDNFGTKKITLSAGKNFETHFNNALFSYMPEGAAGKVLMNEEAEILRKDLECVNQKHCFLVCATLPTRENYWVRNHHLINRKGKDIFSSMNVPTISLYYYCVRVAFPGLHLAYDRAGEIELARGREILETPYGFKVRHTSKEGLGITAIWQEHDREAGIINRPTHTAAPITNKNVEPRRRPTLALTK
ncbi:MAG: hypothetical protein LBU87_00085 [Lactobacillales bacterium]|jgi:hypothetical protein|nr:hypothetical protein [Lactobacillales bacterium]